jgi:anti-anti-sigma factor
MLGRMTETLVQVDGRLESGAVPAFQGRLTAASPLGTEKVLLDLSRVSFIGSAALRAILMAAKQLGTSGGRLAIFAPPHIAEMFSLRTGCGAYRSPQPGPGAGVVGRVGESGVAR